MAERIVADVLRGRTDVEDLEVPDDPSALFPTRLPDDAEPARWARRIVEQVLQDQPDSVTAAPLIDDQRPIDPAAAAPRPGPVAVLPAGRRSYHAVLTGDAPLALLPGTAADPDGRAWAPTAPEPSPLERAVDHALDTIHVAPVVAPEVDTAWEVADDVDDAPVHGRNAVRTAAWVLLALVWVGAAASLVPLAFEGTEAAVDFTFDIWDQ